MFDLSRLRPLPKQAEHELEARHDSEVRQLLPMLGPLFGLVVILFTPWDYLIDPLQVWSALAVRVTLVLLGSIAYLPTRLPWTPVQRCGYIYGTHAGALILSEFLLQDGFLYGLTGIAASVFTVSVVTLRLRTFVLILSTPTLLFVVLSAIKLPRLAFLSGLMLYLFSVCLAYMVMLAIRFFRLKAFWLETELLHISRHDSLTGVWNRGYLTELAEREIALAKRHGRPLAVAMLDIDHFKEVNDSHGHDTGDHVLKMLADSCMENLRVIDHFGRIGGEEFACVLPETDPAEARRCAERLRQGVEALQIDTPQGPLGITVSIGVANLHKDHAGWSALLRDADTALYRAKHEGRNRVILAASCTQ